MSTDATHYLFICSANRNRSKAAERICIQMAQAKGQNVQCESAGVDPLAERQVTKQIADRADTIFVMEPYMKSILESEFHQNGKKIVCFDIPDIYPIDDPMLEAILIKKLTPYL